MNDFGSPEVFEIISGSRVAAETSLKIVITLRTDLLDRVLEKTRDSGFQREKYTSLFLALGWKKSQLETLLNKRINLLLKYKYTNGDVQFSDVFPPKIDKVTSLDYILDRTLLRPRDAIIFVNECLKEAQGKTKISSSDIKLAEKAYSAGRVESLKYEWYVEHPMLGRYIDMLHQKNASFKASALGVDNLEALVIDIAEQADRDCDIVVKNAISYMDSEYPESKAYLNQLRQNLLFILYKVGAVGVKVDGTSTVKWIHDRTQDLTPQKIQPTSIIYIHKILWRALAIDKRS